MHIEREKSGFHGLSMNLIEPPLLTQDQGDCQKPAFQHERGRSTNAGWRSCVLPFTRRSSGSARTRLTATGT